MVLPCLLGLCRHPLSSSPRSTCSRVGLPPTIKRKCQNRIQFVKQANERRLRLTCSGLRSLKTPLKISSVVTSSSHVLISHATRPCKDIHEQMNQLPVLRDPRVDIAVCGDTLILMCSKTVRYTLMLRTLSALMKPTRRRTLFMRFNSSFITRPWCCTHNDNNHQRLRQPAITMRES